MSYVPLTQTSQSRQTYIPIVQGGAKAPAAPPPEPSTPTGEIPIQVPSGAGAVLAGNEGSTPAVAPQYKPLKDTIRDLASGVLEKSPIVRSYAKAQAQGRPFLDVFSEFVKDDFTKGASEWK